MTSSTSRRPRLGLWDLVPAVPLLFVGLIGTGQAADNQRGFRDRGVHDGSPFGDGVEILDGWALSSPGVLAYALVVIAALSLLLRRRAPVAGLVACGLAISLYLALGFPFGPILLTAPAAAYAVGNRLPWRPASAWGTAFLVATIASVAPQFVGATPADWFGYAVWASAWVAIVGAAGAIGGALQVRRRSEAGVRTEQARRAVSEERLEMARDVHDGVGHGLAVIAMHAGVALHVLDREPERARELLLSIQSTSRESLEGLREDLERLRSNGESAGEAARRPSPGLDDLPLLLARMRNGGLVLHDEIEPVTGVPADVGAAAYRIVQESLTNVLRHAGDTPAWVRVRRRDETLVVEVRDRGTATTAGPEHDPAPGTGIAGMRHRAAAVGGHLAAAPADDGGFVVHAELPLVRVTASEGVSQ